MRSRRVIRYLFLALIVAFMIGAIIGCIDGGGGSYSSTATAYAEPLIQATAQTIRSSMEATLTEIAR